MGSPKTRSRRTIAGNAEFVAREIDQLETSIERYRSGQIPDAVFLEGRLRHGIYGQRQDGAHMLRSKLPLGLIGADQLEAFADIAERFGGGVAHLTTRQDIQVHFVELENTPALLRALDWSHMTSREACGNVVRNVTAAEDAGISPTEAFDVTPYGMALAEFLLRHPDGQSLGRKVKVHFAGCPDTRRNLGAFHDLGFTAVVRQDNTTEHRGFRVLVGGGLGAVAYEAQELTEFLPEQELLPFAQAVLRVFAQHGEKKKRARARLKFLVAGWGIDRFREEVDRERNALVADGRWTRHLDDLPFWDDRPLHGSGEEFPSPCGPDEEVWLRTNTERQRQAGYAAVKIRVPQGDLDPGQLRGLAEVLREHTGDSLRITVDQALFLRWVPFERLSNVRHALIELGLGKPCAGGLGDTVTCPGADTCKLGITSPRLASRSIVDVLDELSAEPRLENIRIKISGCPNACSQHHVADIGFFGAARTVDGVTSPHYMLLLGGLAGGTDGETLGAGFGIPIAKIPAARLGEVVTRLCNAYLEGSRQGEPFGMFARRLGRAHFRRLLEDLTELPSFEEASVLYREPASETEFSVRRGTGECAGAVVDFADLLLADADREADRAAKLFAERAETGETVAAANLAMQLGARSLLSTEHVHPEEPADVEREFRSRFYDKGLIYEGVGHTFLQACGERPEQVTGDRLRRLVVEASLFVEEAHSMLARMREVAE